MILKHISRLSEPISSARKEEISDFKIIRDFFHLFFYP